MHHTTDMEHTPLTPQERAAYLERTAARRARLAEARRMLTDAAEQVRSALEAANEETEESAIEYCLDSIRALLASPSETVDAYETARSYLAAEKRRAVELAKAENRDALIAFARRKAQAAARSEKAAAGRKGGGL